MKVGDVVYLRSGSPPMTVRALEHKEPESYVNLVWISFPGAEPQHISLPAACLTSVKPD